jgi:hypothetical protein
MAKAPTKSKRKSNASRFGEDVVRKAMTVAVMKRSNRGYAWTQAAKTIGSRKDVVAHWPERYPQIWEEVKADCQKALRAAAPDLAELLLENAYLAATEWNLRLRNDPGEIKDFALTGHIDYAIKNAGILKGKDPDSSGQVTELVTETLKLLNRQHESDR